VVSDTDFNFGSDSVKVEARCLAPISTLAGPVVLEAWCLAPISTLAGPVVLEARRLLMTTV